MLATDRHFLRLLRLALTAGCVAMWLWLRGWPTGATVGTALVFAVSSVALVHARGPTRPVGTVLALAVTFSNLAAFYASMDAAAPFRERLSILPFGPALLSTSVLWALGDSLFSAEPLLVEGVRRLSHVAGRRAFGIVYGLSLTAVVAFAADLFFLGRGTPFAYRRPALSTTGASAGEGEYAGAHAAERFVVDLRHHRFAQRKPAGTVRIVLNGASTMWGHLLEAENAPAATLSRLLADRYPDRKFEVVCLAWPAKYQLNELVDSVAAIPHWQPDLVVSFNGFNEVWLGENSDRFEALPVWEPQLSAASSVPPAAALFYAHSHFGAELWPSLLERHGATPMGLREPDLYEPPRYYQYLDSTARMLAGSGIPYVYAFCPNRFEKLESERVTNPAMAGVFEEVRQRRHLAQRIVEAAKQRNYDVMASLAALTAEEAFIDDCHLSKAGVKAVMTDVAAHVVEWLEAPRPGDGGPAPHAWAHSA